MMLFSNKKTNLIKTMSFLLTMIFVVLNFIVLDLVYAQAKNCPSNMSSAECARLNNELNSLEKEIAEWQKVLDETKAKKNSLQGDVTILNAEIAKAEKEIKQRNIIVSNLNYEINKKISNINSLEERINNNKKLLANLIKNKSQNELEPIFYLLLSQQDLNNLITDIDEIDSVNQALQDLFIELRSDKTVVEKEKEDLDNKKNKELDVKYEVEQKKKAIAQNEAEKKKLLTLTQREEVGYQQVLAERQRQAEVIRSALFDLRDAGGISFAKALEYANFASSKTGVRPALILAILEQESDLGKNVGTCNRAGDPPSKNYTVIMPGPIHYANYIANGKSCTGASSPCSWRDDQTIFKDITTKLGMDYNTTPLSCPIASVGGWGGAMGPSQFIPTTWRSYEAKLSKLLGVKTPNPWNPEHSFTATALYLADVGATSGTYTAEKNAAAKYYAGSNYLKGPGQSYGNSVIAKAEKHQANIDFLKNL
jgi:peptidoglycan hydrolase CwlO-like protein